ncbi:hypothetical protein [Ktedonospora formicarum]|uniref:Uncharacterized protein n=1 Tax=Ktedonospora formicarum TaxID=2778364 RepID=A0A8J3MNQ3_9CHLR|nr:hypothetical protein [Ktedonospora formicarum]GHO43017.1 hypothetical protein KSX_11800 [Ktedonospora formicarum]
MIAIFFVIVQLSLFARLVMKFVLHTPDDQQWVTALYSFSTVFLVPMQWLALQIHLPFTLDPEFYVLPAILLYGLLARILVGMARFIVRSF